MKAAKIFTFLFLTMAAASSSPSPEIDGWTPSSLDQRRAIPNNSSAPERLSPLHELQPLSNDEGVIRRVKLPDGVKAVALTFDMCELDTNTTGCDMDVLNFLRERGLPATLFMGGKWMRTHSRRVKQIMNEGELFEIGNHNWSHGNCALLSPEGLKAQVLWTQSEYELLREESGATDIPDVPGLFRLPYGRNNERALKVIAGLGLRVIQWDVAAEAGDNSNPKRAARSARLVAGMTRPGSILLFHANLVPKGTVNLLRELVDILEGEGYEFVKVSELLEMGEPETVRDGYFSRPKDNYALDKKFGVDGTGRRKAFTGKP
ncbi:MAG: polysaccharide deacetylase family protein [Synergistaceae bacterium]|nr:polysaccharide deacetylase family protein [Synergistaceae bacterium]